MSGLRLCIILKKYCKMNRKKADLLAALGYSDKERNGYKKSQLTNKQKKARAANKRAKQSRKRNR